MKDAYIVRQVRREGWILSNNGSSYREDQKDGQISDQGNGTLDYVLKI